LWASTEALVTPEAQQRAIEACGDDTVRTRVYDIVRQRNWPEEYDLRLVTNPLIEAWHRNESDLWARLPETLNAFEKAVAEQDFDMVTPIVGEAISLIHDVRPAADIVRDMVSDATRILNRAEAPSSVEG
jgi:nitronate monooxygenase